MAFLAAPAGAAVSLRADYRFDTDRSSSIPGAPVLDVVGTPGSIGVTTVGDRTDSVYYFPLAGGLRYALSSMPDPAAYSVVMRFRLDSTTGYRRILDFDTFDSDNDNGLYAFDGVLDFFDDTTMATLAPAATIGSSYLELAFVRNAAGRVDVYQNGVRQLTHTDTNDQAVVRADGLRFFKDDGSEESSGVADRIRIYDGALSARQVTDIYAVGGLRPSAEATGKVRSKDGGDGLVVKTGIELSCPDEGVACPAKVILTEKPRSGQMVGKRLGVAKGDLGAGSSETIKLAPSKRGQRILKRRGRIKVRVDAGITSGSGAVDAARNSGRI